MKRFKTLPDAGALAPGPRLATLVMVLVVLIELLRALAFRAVKNS